MTEAGSLASGQSQVAVRSAWSWEAAMHGYAVGMVMASSRLFEK
jgi:hypothetical protein